jgi:hypothetical protein
MIEEEEERIIGNFGIKKLKFIMLMYFKVVGR